MTTAVGIVRVRLARAGHLPKVLVDADRALAPLLGGRASRLAAGPPVDGLLAEVLDRGRRAPAEPSGGGARG